MAMQLIQRLNSLLGEKLALRTIYEAPTIRQLAARLASSNPTTNTSHPLRLMNGQGKKPFLFCFPPLGGDSFTFQEMAQQLHHCTVYAADFLPEPDLISRYADFIRAQEPEGPVVLLGYSAGGSLAYEVAAMLMEVGCIVSDLILLDATKNGDLDLSDLDESQLFQWATSYDEAAVTYLQSFEQREQLLHICNHYIHHFHAITYTSRITANITLIYAEDNSRQSTSWLEQTGATYQELAGFGSHFGMLSGEALVGNAALIQRILA